MTDKRRAPDDAPGPLLLDLSAAARNAPSPSPSPLGRGGEASPGRGFDASSGRAAETTPVADAPPLVMTLDERSAAKITTVPDPVPSSSPFFQTGETGADPAVDAAGAAIVAGAPAAPKWPLRLLVGGAAAAVSISVGMDAADMLTRAFAVGPGLGWGAAAALGAAGLGLVGVLWREWRGLARLRRFETLRRRSEHADETDGPGGEAAQTVGAVVALYRGRPELAPGLERLRLNLPDAHDDKRMLELLEREVLAPLDAAAYRLTSAAARDTALATALIPVALLDMLIVAWRNLKLVRAVADVYGVRPGYWGSLRLMRKLLGNLAVAGAGEGMTHVAVDALGGSLAAAVSVNLGKGVVNGLLTARIGLAAMHFCRPAAFSPARRPTLGAIRGALLGLSKTVL